MLNEIGLRLQISLTTLHSNDEQNWEDLCIQLRNQQTCASDNHILIRGGMILNLVFHRVFANAIHELLCKSNW